MLPFFPHRERTHKKAPASIACKDLTAMARTLFAFLYPVAVFCFAYFFFLPLPAGFFMVSEMRFLPSSTSFTQTVTTSPTESTSDG